MTKNQFLFLTKSSEMNNINHNIFQYINMQYFTKNIRLSILTLLLSMSLIASCNNDSSENVADNQSGEMSNMKMAPESAQSFGGEMRKGNLTEPAQDMQVQPEQPVNKMLIKTGNIDIEVKDVMIAKGIVDKMVTSNNAYYSDENLNKSDYRFDYFLTIRIPSQSFDSFLSNLGSINGTITRQSVSAQDVTSEYLDLEVRMANKTAYLERYREILKKAQKVSEILEVEEKIRVIEEEMESVKGRLKYLNSQVSFSTLMINLYQINDLKMKPEDSFFTRLWSSIGKGWKAMTEFVLIFVMLWPFLIIGIIVFYIIYRWVRKPAKKV
jgi:hypothetical protein